MPQRRRGRSSSWRWDCARSRRWGSSPLVRPAHTLGKQSPCPLSPAPGLRGGSAGGAGRLGWNTPLDYAAECKQPEGAAADGVRLLLAAGADATAKNRSGRTALHHAAISGPDDPSLAGLLLGAGCDPAAKTSDGYTALDLAESVSYTHLTLPTINSV